jgi:hypothetical protein
VPALCGPIEAVCDRLEKAYSEGGSLPTLADVALFVDRLLIELTVLIHDRALLHPLARLFHTTINEALYVRQGLRWAAEVSRRMRISLAVYGDKWEADAEFGRLYRGPAEAARGKFFLHLQPSMPTQSVRTISAMQSGAFFLYRDHPAAAALLRLEAGVLRLAGKPVDTVEQVRVLLDRRGRMELEQLLANVACIAEQCDPVAAVGEARRGGLLLSPDGVFPGIAAQTFSDRKSLEDRVRRFKAKPGEREKIALSQQAAVAEKLSPAGSLRQALGQIRERFLEESEHAQRPKIVIAA